MKASARNSWGVMVLIAGAALCSPGQAANQAAYRFDSATVSGLPARNIGSATMSGRIAALDAVEENGRITAFGGAASGGGWWEGGRRGQGHPATARWSGAEGGTRGGGGEAKSATSRGGGGGSGGRGGKS